MRPNRPAQGSSSDAISTRARHIIKRQQRSHHSRLQAPQSGPNGPGHRSRGRPFMPAETKPPTPVAARKISTREGKGRSAHRALIGSRSPCAAWHPHPPPPGGNHQLNGFNKACMNAPKQTTQAHRQEKQTPKPIPFHVSRQPLRSQHPGPAASHRLGHDSGTGRM
jgi:hypothetical protein